MKKLLHVISPVLDPPVFFKCGKLFKKNRNNWTKFLPLQPFGMQILAASEEKISNIAKFYDFHLKK